MFQPWKLKKIPAQKIIYEKKKLSSNFGLISHSIQFCVSRKNLIRERLKRMFSNIFFHSLNFRYNFFSLSPTKNTIDDPKEWSTITNGKYTIRIASMHQWNYKINQLKTTINNILHSRIENFGRTLGKQHTRIVFKCLSDIEKAESKTIIVYINRGFCDFHSLSGHYHLPIAGCNGATFIFYKRFFFYLIVCVFCH